MEDLSEDTKEEKKLSSLQRLIADEEPYKPENWPVTYGLGEKEARKALRKRLFGEQETKLTRREQRNQYLKSLRRK